MLSAKPAWGNVEEFVAAFGRVAAQETVYVLGVGKAREFIFVCFVQLGEQRWGMCIQLLRKFAIGVSRHGLGASYVIL